MASLRSQNRPSWPIMQTDTSSPPLFLKLTIVQPLSGCGSVVLAAKARLALAKIKAKLVGLKYWNCILFLSNALTENGFYRLGKCLNKSFLEIGML